MKPGARLMAIISCCIVAVTLQAQNLDGVWRGTLTQGPGGCYPIYYIELQVHDGKEGVSYSYYDTTKYVKLAFRSEFKAANKRMLITESRVLEFKIPSDCIPCIKTFDLTWRAADGNEYLSGEWHGSQMGSVRVCPPGHITLQRVGRSSFTNQPLQAQVSERVPQSAKEGSRRIDLVKTILVDTLHLSIELYDSGQIDGDSVSIFLNHEVILFKKRLAETPLLLDLPIIAGKDYEMVMFAENLGAIPPNTAIMVVRAGNKKHEIYLSSSGEKSAAVRFRYAKQPSSSP